MRLIRLSALMAGALAGACVFQAPHAIPGEAGPGGKLREVHGDYRLQEPFMDFYDTAFVLTQGPGAPRLAGVAQLAHAVSSADVVFYGESHGHPAVHLAEMRLLRALYQLDPRWILSLEQFERDTQRVVDDYLAGRIGENTLIDKGRAWTNYPTSYRPLLLFAVRHHLPVVAAEAPGWVISCIGQQGPAILEKLTPLERSWVARNMNVTEGAYRDKYLRFLQGSPSHAAESGNGRATAASQSTEAGRAAVTTDEDTRAQRSFSAQVARDDTMAESIERALRAHPGYRVLHLTGSFHSSEFLGTVERLRLRNPALKIAVVDPVEIDDPDAPAFAASDLKNGTALQLIEANPVEFAAGEDTSVLMSNMMRAREASRCKYSLP